MNILSYKRKRTGANYYYYGVFDTYKTAWQTAMHYRKRYKSYWEIRKKQGRYELWLSNYIHGY